MLHKWAESCCSLLTCNLQCIVVAHCHVKLHYFNLSYATLCLSQFIRKKHLYRRLYNPIYINLHSVTIPLVALYPSLSAKHSLSYHHPLQQLIRFYSVKSPLLSNEYSHISSRAYILHSVKSVSIILELHKTDGVQTCGLRKGILLAG